MVMAVPLLSVPLMITVLPVAFIVCLERCRTVRMFYRHTLFSSCNFLQKHPPHGSAGFESE